VGVCIILDLIFYIRIRIRIRMDLKLKKLIKIAMNLFGIQKMEDGSKIITTSTLHVEDVKDVKDEAGKVLSICGREEKKEWDPRRVKKELYVLAWALSLGQEHPDFGFFRGGECKKCAGCSHEFNLLHYTSEKNAYCVRCYLDGFCDIVFDSTIFMVVIKKSGRILIEIHNPNE